MTENKDSKVDISKYLEKRSKSSPTRLDSILRAYVKGKVETFCVQYHFINNIFVNLPVNKDPIDQNETDGKSRKCMVSELEKTFLGICFEKGGYYGDINFFDDYYEYYILNEDNPEFETIAVSAEYGESDPLKYVIDEVWNKVEEFVRIDENARNAQIKKRNSKYKIIYFICYALSCLCAVGVILYNRTSGNSKALWFLALALIPAAIGSYFKYKTLDKNK